MWIYFAITCFLICEARAQPMVDKWGQKEWQLNGKLVFGGVFCLRIHLFFAHLYFLLAVHHVRKNVFCLFLLHNNSGI